MKQQDILEQTNQISNNSKRPTAVTLICVLGFIGVAFTVPLVFNKFATQIASWYPFYLGISSIIGLICIIGLWNMKKWAAYSYTGFVLINLMVTLILGDGNIGTLIVPLIVVVVSLVHVNKMD